MFIQVSDLEKSYGDGESTTQVLKKINCAINRGSICCLLGPSGSGKSTLLNILGGIDSIDAGQVIVNDERIETYTARQLAEYRRNSLGFIFQFYNLVPNLTVRENIETGYYLGTNPLDLDEMIETLGLTEHQNKFPSQLSGGQQQRTGIGRALIKNPVLLLCDEPTGALDYQTGKEVLALLQKINHTYGTTIVIATHNQAFAGISHEVMRLRDGKIKEHTVKTDVADASELVW